MGSIARLCLFLLAGSAVLLTTGVAAADGPEIGIDAVTEGNSATEIGQIDSCIEVANGAEVTVDMYVKDVDDALALDAFLRYDPAIVEVTGRDADEFLGNPDDSNVLDLSEQTPDGDGRFVLSAANASDSSRGASGSGVLARITFNAVGTGITELDLRAEDVNGDGEVDRGTILRDANADLIESDSDGYFGGTIRNAAIAVDADCADAVIAVSAAEDDGGSSVIWVIVAAAAVVLLMVGAGALVVRRRRAAAPTGLDS
ncbi:MAG: cohesin domain-containing protein [Dehalococcoidia bacterium]